MVSITSSAFPRYRSCYQNKLNHDKITNAKNLQQNKSRFSLIVEQTLVFTWSNNLVKEVKNVPRNFKWITWRCFSLLKVFIRLGRSTLSLNYNLFYHILCSNSLYTVDITYLLLQLNSKFPIFPEILVNYW